MITSSVYHLEYIAKHEIRQYFSTSRLIKIATWLLVALLIWVFRQQLLDMLSLVGDKDRLILYLEDYGQVGAILLFIILWLQVLFAMIPGHVFMVVGGYLYGLAVGFLITHASTVIGSQICYLLTKIYSRLGETELAEQFAEKARAAAADEPIRDLRR